MDKYEFYRAWAPEAAIWSPWVKPTLFAYLPFTCQCDVEERPALPDYDWLRSPGRETAVLLDLCGVDSINVGLRLAREFRYRPVPLFVSCPPESAAVPALVPTNGALRALEHSTPNLVDLHLPDNAPPVFLLDANRWAPGLASSPINTFDNRSALFASDLPSATLLGDRGITRCLVVRDPTIPLGEDLGYSLTPWRKAGIVFEFVAIDGTRLEFAWPPGNFWSRLFHRATLLFTLKPATHGGFGRFIPESSGG